MLNATQEAPERPWPAFPLIRGDAMRLQITRIVDHACNWLLSDELFALATALHEASDDLREAADQWPGRPAP